MKQLQCYAFACPPCFDEELAGSCKDYVLSVALRDDVVSLPLTPDGSSMC